MFARLTAFVSKQSQTTSNADYSHYKSLNNSSIILKYILFPFVVFFYFSKLYGKPICVCYDLPSPKLSLPVTLCSLATTYAYVHEKCIQSLSMDLHGTEY